MILYIKNMVSTSGITAVKNELEKLGFNCTTVELGEANIVGYVSEKQKEDINRALKPYGLELMADPKCQIIEKIKNIIVKAIHFSEEEYVYNLSEYISSELNRSYNYLSNIFSEMQGITIEKYVILHKVEKVKEMLVYDDLTVNEIAYKMQYSSLAHLSSQFKKVTGFTPSYFKRLKDKHKQLKELDKL